MALCGSQNMSDTDKSFSLTPEEYQVTYWPTIQSAIRFLLSQPEGTNCSLSYERVYGSVYNCVCRHYGEPLFRDLCYEVRSHFNVVANELKETKTEDLINKFDQVLQRFKTALDGIIPLFNCMNRFYLGNKLETDLKTELSNIFVSVVANDVVYQLLEAVERVQNIPFSVDPAVVARVVKALHCLNKEYVSMAPTLFARYIPNVLPPMQLSDLPNFVVETQQYQEYLRSVGFRSGDQSRKRAGDEMTVPTFHPSDY